MSTLEADSVVKRFGGLLAVDLNDRQSPHDKTYKRNEALVDAWLDRLAGLPDLVSLDLANTGMQGPGLKVVGTLKNLERLNLTLTPITDAHAASAPHGTCPAGRRASVNASPAVTTPSAARTAATRAKAVSK